MVLKGGFQKKIDFDKVIELGSPHRNNMDCCPCTFRFLDLINDDEFNILLDNFGDIGMNTRDMVNLFKKQYGDYSDHYYFGMEEADFSNKSKQEVINIIYNLFKFIKKGYGVIGGITRAGNTSHCVVLFRDMKGNPYILDAQSNELYSGNVSKSSKTFKDFFYGNWVKKFHYLIGYNTKENKVLEVDETGNPMIFEDAIELDDSDDYEDAIELDDSDDYEDAIELDDSDDYEDAIEARSKTGGKKKRTKKKRTKKKRTKKRTKL